MKRRFREQIEYGNRPERMDPRIEKKLKDEEGLYGKNPAFPKGTKDVERLVSSRFQKVADKLSQVTGIQDLSSRQVQGMVMQQMLSKIPSVVNIESRHKQELEDLAIQSVLEETETPEDWYEIVARLNRQPIDVSNFRFQPEEKEENNNKIEQLGFESFDVDDLTEEEELELEIHKRNLVNALVQGAAKKGHYLFQKPEIKSKLDAIDPSLYPAYLGVMAVNDFMYFTMEQMIEMMSQTGNGVAGKTELQDAGGDDEGEGGEETPDTRIVADGLIFPILCHELIKGIEEAKARYGLPKSDTLRSKVLGQTDTLGNEPMQLRIGPEIVEKIRNILPTEMFDKSNVGLINWFHIQLYQLPAKEFLTLIGDVISADKSRNDNARERFEEIMKEAEDLKYEYDNYKEEKGIDDEDETEEDMYDFLRDMGIVPPSLN